MNRLEILRKLGLGVENSIVIGSGIMGILGIRDSDDIDLVVTKDAYEKLTKNSNFHFETHYGREILVDDKIEIGVNWRTLGGLRDFEKLCENSIVIDDVRYCTLDFIYDVKKYWIDHDDSPRDKDFRDLKLIDKYRRDA